MKQNIIFFVLCLLTSTVVYAQPCRQITIDSTQKRILFNYIEECEKDGYFVGDKGVIVVTRFIRDGRPAWSIHVVLDDRYKDNPPIEWTQLNSDIILFYNAETQHSYPEKITATPELLACLDEAIGDRLYIRPPRRDRAIVIPRPGKEPIKAAFRRLRGISGLNQKIVIFEANGKVTILDSV